ncbi:MAG: hypothetical protein IPO94_19670 [Saprospiraceae bacterium]|nr:hypothetical protein [Saprospiraceae bacterium]
MATLNKYAGPWSRYLAAHLLRRTTYGVNYDTLVKFGNYTLDQCLDHLLQPLGDPPPPTIQVPKILIHLLAILG